MAKLLTFAVAGSGKTTRIVRSIDPGRRSLILTYTTANIENVRRKVIDHFGTVPELVTIAPYFSFLFSFCLRPFLADRLGIEGINYDHVDNTFTKATSDAHYMNFGNRIWSSRIVKAIVNYGFEVALVERLNRYFDCVYVDEVQDLSSRDFDFLGILAKTRLDVEIVGDFFQHTYSSSSDLTYRSGLFHNFGEYRKELIQFGYIEHSEQLARSHRCSKSVCNFVSENLGIPIQSASERSTSIENIVNGADCLSILGDPSIVKLFANQHHLYGCVSRNWGECKGEDDYVDVCVVLNKTSNELFRKGRLIDSAPLTRNKLYVAITRSRGSLYFVSEDLVKKVLHDAGRLPL